MPVNDLTGKKFNRLTAVRQSYYHQAKRTWVWEFLCDCGKVHFSKGSDVKSGHVKSCGCLRLEKLREKPAYNFDDMTGKVFGRLTVLYRSERKTKNFTRWLCKCECGVLKEIDRGNLVTGQIVSCGCYNSQNIKERKTTHGMSKTRLYKVWSYMITRCYNEKFVHFPDYGGRGIVMCDEWRNDFMIFYHDMKDGYQRGLQLDRINVNGNYCKENCRWATAKQNARNKRNNVYATINGETKLVVEWAEENAVKNYTSIHRRLKNGFKERHLLHGKPKFDAKKMIVKKKP